MRSRDIKRRPARHTVASRLEGLEARVAELEERLSPARRPGPPPGRRCPGCQLELPKGLRSGTCIWCGFVLQAVKPARAR